VTWRRAAAGAGTLAALGLTGACAAPAEPVAVTEVSGEPAAWVAVKEPVTVDLPDETPLNEPARAGARGDVVLLNVWASYCTFCIPELAMLQRAATQRDVTVIGVSRDATAKPALRSLAKAEVTYPNQLDPDGDYLAALRGVVPRNVLPVTALWVDGEVTAVHIGPLPDYRSVVKGLSFAAE
jgi:thiol-disulfide isomerase/thioredoxin